MISINAINAATPLLSMTRGIRFCPFRQKGRFSGQKTQFFQNFGAFGAEIVFFSATLGGRSVESPLSLGRALPQIPLETFPKMTDFF